MTKSKRIRNKKLRKQIMRTASALTMTMAIVLAAIPVENLGTVQADSATTMNVQLDYAGDLADTTKDSAVQKYYDKTKYDDKYSSNNTITIQRIEKDENDNPTLFIDAFTAYKKTNLADTSAMITKNLIESGDGINSITIKDSEYYDYIHFNGDFLSDVKTAFGTTNIAVQFKDGTMLVNEAQKTVDTSDTVSGVTTTGTATLKAIKIIQLDGDIEKATDVNSITINPSLTAPAKSDAHDYINFEQTSLSAKEIYKDDDENGKKLLSSRQTQIDEYNNKVNEIYNKIKNLVGKSPLTTEEVNTWNSCVDELEGNGLNQDYSDLRVLSNQIGAFDVTGSINGAVRYAILQKCYGKTTNDNLKGFSLQEIPTIKGSLVYIPQFLGGALGSNQKLDGRKGKGDYLITGTVTIDGIASEAFKNDKAITDEISIPNSVVFIGESAFENANVNKITFNLGKCEIVGYSAFKNCSRLSEVNFVDTSSDFGIIDKEAFEGSGITSIVIPYSVTTIGAGAFANSALTSLRFADDAINTSGTTISPYAFYNCGDLSSVTFPTKGKYIIKRAAFAMEPNSTGQQLTEFTFPETGSAMVYDDNGGGLGDEDYYNYDYILTNRTALLHVTFPGSLSGKIPDNTLAGCTELEWVKFPDGAYGATYTPKELFKSVYNPDFYVMGPKTGAGPNSVAVPRETTWKAKAGLEDATSDLYLLDSVPYMYEDSEGTHFEIGIKEGDELKYIAQIDEIPNTDHEAVLSDYSPYNKDGVIDNMHITIPGKVGEYTVVELGENCINSDIRNKVYWLTIQDDSVRKINDSAFKGCSALQLVEIGNDVTYIGENAFANCTKLQNVVFSQTSTGTYEDNDSRWTDAETALVLGDNAFNTQSPYLTFYGAINENYAPFKLAMSDKSVNMTSSKAQICYKTDDPLNSFGSNPYLNLTVMRDNTTGRATLIDYPHYDEIDTVNEKLRDDLENSSGITNYSIIDKFETINKVQTDTNITQNYSSYENMDPDEDAAVMNTLYIDLPSGIQSIDSKSYFKSANNSSDQHYFDLTYEVVEETPSNATDTKSHIDDEVKITRNLNQLGKGIQDVRELYYSYEGQTVTSAIETIAGLFSGFFDESKTMGGGLTLTSTVGDDSGLIGKTYASHYYYENNDRGNDYLTEIDTGSVELLQDFAFDSAENLKKVVIGSGLGTNLQDDESAVGQQPFRDCTSLDNIDTSANDNYEYDNMLFCEKKDDGTYKIIQSLESRGVRSSEVPGGDANFGSTTINLTSNPILEKVSEIADYAFADNGRIDTVDLSASSVSIIPQYAFSECGNLRQVTLPSTIKRIDQNAFDEATDGGKLVLEVPNPLCTITTEAFDFDTTDSVEIRGIPYMEDGTTTSPTYDSYLQLAKVYNVNNDERVTWENLGTKHTLTFWDDDLNVITSLEIDDGQDLLSAPEAPAKSGKQFKGWVWVTSDGQKIYDDIFTNITENRSFYAIYDDDPSSVVGDGKTHQLTVTNGYATIFNSDGSISTITTFPAEIYGGTQVILNADSDIANPIWSVTPASYTSLIRDVSLDPTVLTMPNADITVTANRGDGTSNGGTSGDGTNNGGTSGDGTSNGGTSGDGTSNGGTSGDGTSSGDATTKYNVVVNYGSGSGSYAAGEVVSISAYAPTSSTKVFSKWTSNNSSLGFADSSLATTTFVMPASDVTVTANYKTRSDDDDDTVSSRPGTSTSTTTVSNRPSDSTTTTTTSTVTNGNGNKIIISNNGVSNKDVASIAVDGSTDNFIVKISETDEANEMAKQALTNAYGSLDNISYFPMDISLYDSTGQNKITNTTGLNITVTMPIPDDLIQYGGNARVAATDNGNLQQITPKFTTIDGIACISFVPPHFSPYVIYVDKSNLIAGQMYDATPATGDPIHPKWFAVIGMACLSVLLFAGSTPRRRRRYRTA